MSWTNYDLTLIAIIIYMQLCIVVISLQTVCTGSWIYKFTNNGKGPLHPRYFWVNPSNIKVTPGMIKAACANYLHMKLFCDDRFVGGKEKTQRMTRMLNMVS